MARPKRQHSDTRVKINLPFDEALAALARASRRSKPLSTATPDRSDDAGRAESADRQRETDA